jgi:DNA-binding NtrC family response regulator
VSPELQGAIIHSGIKMKKLKILLVDDESGVLETYEAMLDKQCYEVTTALDGLEALDKIKKYDYDMMITDWHHPEIDGIELLKKAKELKKDFITIMISGTLTRNATNEAKRLGCFSCIVKPFSIEQVVSIIKEAFTKKGLRVN